MDERARCEGIKIKLDKAVDIAGLCNTQQQKVNTTKLDKIVDVVSLCNKQQRGRD
jgi:hypothetical protein